MGLVGDSDARVNRKERKDLLRFITCGSVDDGKSTLIGRLLHDTRSLADDQMAALEADSRRHGTQGGEMDFALLVDGLAAEREQGITIDVAYRYFDTAYRKFIVADCPGHAQYTRNMATGASTADLAIVLVDARKGLVDQTRRHSYIAALLGVRHVVVAVNKMDLIGYDQGVFNHIADAYRQFALLLDLPSIHCIPLSALKGDNLLHRSPAMPWYHGPALLELLEAVEVGRHSPKLGFRMPVQWVSRPDRSDPARDVRAFAGTLVAGNVRPGDAVVALPAGTRSTVARIVTADGDLESARAGQAVMLVLNDELDVSRGDLLACASHPPDIADQFAAHLLWMDTRALLPGRPYWMKIGTRTIGATVTALKHKVDIDTQARLAATQLQLNEVGYGNLALDEPVPFEAYKQSRALGGFILIDREDNATVAAGTLDFALRRGDNLHRQTLELDKAARAVSKRQRPCCVWFTGLSGAGKSTIANLVEKQLHASGRHTYLLDGDNVRLGLNRDLGFTDQDRVENIRRVAEVARLMVDAGLIVLVSFISPFRSERRMARALFEEGEFLEVFVDAPLAVAEHRDPKGLYAKARAGHIPNFTGIDSPYERPERAELVLDTTAQDADLLAHQVVARLLDFTP